MRRRVIGVLDRDVRQTGTDWTRNSITDKVVQRARRDSLCILCGNIKQLIDKLWCESCEVYFTYD